MTSTQDTGEFLAISVTNEQPQIAAAQLATRVSALSEQLSALSELYHQRVHRGENTSNTAEHFSTCNMMVCRKNREVLGEGFKP